MSTDGGADAGPEQAAGPTPDRIAAAAVQLYAASQADFVARRTELARAARQDGDPDAAKEVGALRKPSVAAWTVNHLVRVDPQIVQSLITLGEVLRSAQTRLDAGELKRLRGERDRVLRDVVRAAERHAAEAGQRLTTATLAEVHQSAVAALADPAAAAALASGTLTRALSYSGFGEVDLADAVAQTGTGVRLALIRGGRHGEPAVPGPAVDGPAPSQAQETARREGQRRLAELAVARARRDLAATSDAVAAARAGSESAREHLAEVRAELAAAEADDEARLVEVSDAVRARSAAQAAVAAAEQALATLDAP